MVRLALCDCDDFLLRSLPAGVQANAIATSMENAFGIAPAISAGAIAALLSFIVFGGLKRIAAFTTLVVPFMAQAYVIFSLVIVFMHIDMLDDVVSLIVRCAFGADAAFGAIVGMAVSWGVKRGIYSNEAGQGTGPHASSAVPSATRSNRVLCRLSRVR